MGLFTDDESQPQIFHSLFLNLYFWQNKMHHVLHIRQSSKRFKSRQVMSQDLVTEPFSVTVTNLVRLSITINLKKKNALGFIKCDTDSQ